MKTKKLRSPHKKQTVKSKPKAPHPKGNGKSNQAPAKRSNASGN